MDGTGPLPDKLIADLGKAADVIKSAKNVLVITHIDADGISAGAVAVSTLKRLGKDHDIIFEKKITEDTISMVNASTVDVVWICDLGSAYLSGFKRSGIVVTDHHVPDPKWRKKQTFLDDFCDIHHLNPHIYGASGSYEVCGAGMTYLLSKTIDPKNIDLAYLAVVGAVGDFQDSRESKLVSYNRIILGDAETVGDVEVCQDIRFYGRDSRPLTQFLQFCSDPSIPGITDNAAGAQIFFSTLKIPLKNGSSWRTWNNLDPDEKSKAVGALRRLLNDPSSDGHLCGEVYNLPKFNPKTGLRDAKEYATVLNACGRYDDAETGLRICLGDQEAIKDADRNRTDHRRNISVALTYIKENRLLRERRFIQYFDAGSEIRETVVGIVAGMLLNSGDAKKNLPIFAFADADDGVKVSARASRTLTDRGLDLSFVMKTASEVVGGFGGGHSVAAGATIPRGKEEAFLDAVEDIVSSQVI
ncbi:MAG: DHH family phosphoesterase [Candidatus Methanoplasma sp.]|jgi:RecJ-like exonuclease|nr:DHH family phosphoesterase [Candidatus Methanoplasma sp.]